ncbi:MAG: esterase-like activity of phytase family protein [Chthoniobacterales bacterium]
MNPLSFILAVLFFGFLTSEAQTLKLLGRAVLPHKMPVGKTLLGGLSGISYDPTSKALWAVSDDSSYAGGAPRIYQISLQLGDTLQPQIVRALILLDETGQPFSVADCEGIACTGRDSVWVSSEGRAGAKGAPPWIKLFSLKTGRVIRTLPLPAVYLPTDETGKSVPVGSSAQTRGILSNRAMESCSLSPDHLTLYTANESSLLQEKAPGENSEGGASVFNPTQVRISALDAKTGRCLAQKLYISDMGCFFGSISDVSPLDKQGNLLVLERRIIRTTLGTGCTGIRLYRVNLAEESAADLRDIPNVRTQPATSLTKTLVYDSRKEGIDDLDNIEGVALMPLPGGRTGVVMVSDDNFGDDQQTQILLYELTFH